MEGREGLLFPYKERRILFFSVAGGVGGMGESAACGRLGKEGRGYVLKSTEEGGFPSPCPWEERGLSSSSSSPAKERAADVMWGRGKRKRRCLRRRRSQPRREGGVT